MQHGGVRPDVSSSGGYLGYALSFDLHVGEQRFWVIDWGAWELPRNCRSIISAESQAMAAVFDISNFIRLVVAD